MAIIKFAGGPAPGPSPSGQKYSCKGLLRKQCVEDADGTFPSEAACEQSC